MNSFWLKTVDEKSTIFHCKKYNFVGITVYPNLGTYSTAILFDASSGVDLGKVTVRIPSFIEAFTSSPYKNLS
jgi:hypothetical protein